MLTFHQKHLSVLLDGNQLCLTEPFETFASAMWFCTFGLNLVYFIFFPTFFGELHVVTLT